MSDQCSSVFLPVPAIPLLSNSSPTALDLLLTKISNWEVFASHLPGVTQSLIESIKREVPPPQQLEKLLDSWLHICPHASWLHVFIVLLEIKEDELYLAILEDLSSKRPPLSTTRYVVGASKDVVVHDIKDLSQWFTTLLQEVKSTLSDKPLQELVNKTKRFLGLEGGLGQGITNIDQLFNEVQPYCNYLNIELIQYLTRTTTPALASSVTKYAKNLLSFLLSSQLEFITSAMTKPTSSKTKTTSAVTLKLSYHWNKYSLYTLLRAMECCLKVKAIYIRHIIRDKSDSMLLFKLFLPHQLCEHINTLLASNQKQISQFGIMKVDLHTSGHSSVFTSDIEFASFESSCFRAVTDGNAIVLVTMLLLQLVFTDCTNREEETPLMIAAGEGQQQILHTLLALGANVDAFSKKGQNAPMIAFQRNQSAAVRILNKEATKSQQINRRRSASILVTKPKKKKEAQKDVDNASKGGAEHIVTSDAPSEVGGDGKEQGKHIESPSIKEAVSNKADEGSTVAASVDTKQNDESIKKGPCAPVSHTHEEKEVHVSVRHYGPESQNESQFVSKLPTLDAASAVPNEKKEIVREQEHSSLPSQHTQQEQADAVDQASVSSKIHKGKKLSTNEGIKKCSDTETKTAQKQKKAKIKVPPPLPAADIKEEESTENNDQGPQKSQSKITLSPEYKSLKKNMEELADLLSDDPDQIIQVANHLHSNDIIPIVTYEAAKNNHRSAMDRASFLLDSALKAFKANPNRKKLFDVFCTSLERSGIDPTTLRHDAETDATKRESSASTAESLKQIASQDQQINRTMSASISVKKPKKKEVQVEKKEVDNARKGGAEQTITSDAPSEVGGDGKEQHKHIKTPLSIEEAAPIKAHLIKRREEQNALLDLQSTDPCSPVSHTHEEKETCVSDIGHPESQKEGLKLLTLDVASAVPNEEKEEIVTDDQRSEPLLEHEILRENIPELVKILSGSPERMTQVANHLFSKKLIADETYTNQQNVPQPIERATSLLNSVRITIQTNPNRKKLFNDFCTILHQSGINFRHHGNVTIGNDYDATQSTSASLKQITSQEQKVDFNEVDPNKEVKSSIESLENNFIKLAANVRECLAKRIKNNSLKMDDVVHHIAVYTKVPVKELKEAGPDSMFDLDLVKAHYDTFDCRLLEYIIKEILKDDALMKELTKHNESVKEFEQLAPIEQLTEFVKDVIPVEPPHGSCKVYIKVNEAWGAKTKKCLINFLNYWLGRDITSHVYIYRGSICVQFFIPMAESQDIIDRVMSYREDMYQLGIFYMFIGETEIINENDSIDLDEALHYFARNGKHDEVLMSLELGADIDWKNKDGKTALMLATEEKQIQVIKKLRTAGADDSICDNEGNTALDIARETDSRLLSYLTRDKTDKEEDKREEENKELEEMKKKDESKKEKEPEKTAGINLEDPAEQECRLRITQAENHEDIYFQSSRADTVKLFLALLEKEKLKRLVIHDTKLTRRCIKSLANLITTNDTLEELELINCGEKKYDTNIFEEELAEDLCAALVCNTTLKKLSLRSMRLSKGAINAFIDMLHHKQKHLIHLEIDADYHEALCLEHSYYEDIKERLRLVKGAN